MRPLCYRSIMFLSTLEKVRCPRKNCASPLKLIARKGAPLPGPEQDIRQGSLECTKCHRPYPILEGVAILVSDPREYVLQHVKGISQIVPEVQIPKDWLEDYREAMAEIESEHIEEDLESRRVTSLYVMNHYLRADQACTWWKTRSGSFSPEIEALVKRHWDHGPFSKILEKVDQHFSTRDLPETLELGCGVGGLARVLQGRVKSYLGVDSSFASIAIARHLALGCEYVGTIKFPEDLLLGATSRTMDIPPPPTRSQAQLADFVVGHLEEAPLAPSSFDLSIVLNAIDMLEKPAQLPELQARTLKKEGIALQSCPYIWHESVAKSLRGRLPRGMVDSARAVEWLYEQTGLQVKDSLDQIPWLFFKHVRQIELYSVHLFVSQKQGA